MQAMASSGTPRRRGEGGFGLIEAVVSVALVSTVVLALAAGLLTSVRSSTSAKETQELDAALSAYAEAFKDPSKYPSRATPPSDPCVDSSYSSLGVAPPAGASANVTKVEHWEPGAAPKWTTDPCTSDPGVHRLTVSVTMDGSGASGTAQVVMRDPGS